MCRCLRQPKGPVLHHNCIHVHCISIFVITHRSFLEMGSCCLWECTQWKIWLFDGAVCMHNFQKKICQKYKSYLQTWSETGLQEVSTGTCTLYIKKRKLQQKEKLDIALISNTFLIWWVYNICVHFLKIKVAHFPCTVYLEWLYSVNEEALTFTPCSFSVSLRIGYLK